ncbi:hypothetical protein LMG26788_02062 [Achromobacter pulmonis]|uniref:Pilus assembly protein TadE n=3 Tax=Alcaligenaceae TaxID=506 RepID=A0A6S7D2D3_9BURK|nr:hypothetical protein LMG26788_02062 [Achromobacter pulmonis]
MPAPHWPDMTAFFHAPSRPCPRHAGTAAVEFTVAAATVLLLALLAFEAARWQLARQVAHLALLQAARAASTARADPFRMRAAFLQALLPLHAGPGGEAGARLRLTRALERDAALMGAPPWRIEILLPAPPASPRDPAQSRAGTLRLRLTYLYRPLLAPVRALLAMLAGSDDGSYAGRARARGLAPIGLEIEMEMHAGPPERRASQPYPAGMVLGACRRLRCP